MTAAPPPELEHIEGLALQAAVTGRYAVEREVGRGGMGAVFLARDLTLDRPVAIKLLPPALAGRPDLRERFLRETRTAAGLSHPNIVPIYGIEDRGGLVFYVMGYIDGETLAARVRRTGPLPAAEAARILQEVAWALSYAHKHGIVHRDVKPDNVLLDRATGRAYVVDFGIARVASNATMTAVGESIGTPQFMSPEQAAGEAVDARSDLYSLGVVAFHALTGRLPFDAPTVQAVLMMHLTQPPPPLASVRAGLPRPLADAVDRLLHKEPAQRFQSGEELVAALQGMQTGGVQVPAPVRHFLRAAEMSVQMLFTLTVFLLASSIGPGGTPGRTVLMLTCLTVAILGQVAMRADLLVRQGYGFEDVRAALDEERRQRQEESDLLYLAMGSAAGTRRARRRAGAMLLAALALFGGGLALAAHSARGTPLRWLGVGMMVVAVVPYMAAILIFFGRNAQSDRLATRVTYRVVGGWVTRMIFRLVASRAARTPASATAAPDCGELLLPLVQALPRAWKAERRAAERVIAALAAAAEEAQRRERELARTLADIGVSEPGAPDVTARTASLTRARIVAEVQGAQAVALERRTAVLAALESLRLQLLRARAGLATREELAAELAGAGAAEPAAAARGGGRLGGAAVAPGA